MTNKYEDKKIKIKERLKLKLEYSEKIKNEENNKALKKLNNVKKKELPKIKILNYLNNSNIDTEPINNYSINNDNNYKLYNKFKSGKKLYKKEEIDLNRNNILSKSTSENMQNMNLISFNENFNNIYKKVTMNDFNEKEMDQKVFYNIINVDNILETNSDDKKNEDMDYINNIRHSIKYSDKTSDSYKNEQMLFNFLNQNKEEVITSHEQITPIKKNKANGNRFNFLRTNSNYNIGKKNAVIKKYKTNKNSFRKIEINCDNYTNLNRSKTESNKNKFNDKKFLYEENAYFSNKDNLKKSFDNKDSKSMDNYCKSENNNSEEDESSNITIVSLCSEDIKDISSDF